ncbi:MAG: sulfite exporter TauE/SafE family protein [Thermoleophilia bacterium]
MTDLVYLLAAFAIVFGASLVQGAIGFGFALVAMPLFLLYMPAPEAVAISLTVGCFVNAFMIQVERRRVAWRELGAFMPVVTISAIAGVFFLRSLDGPGFEALIDFVFLAMSLMMLAGRSWKASSGLPLQQAVGAISGILIGATSMGGPPMVLYLTGRGLAKERLRGTLAVFFLWGDMVALAALTAGGLFNSGLAVRSMLPVAAVFPGILAGRLLTSRLDHRSFRILVLASMSLTAALGIVLNLASS